MMQNDEKPHQKTICRYANNPTCKGCFHFLYFKCSNPRLHLGIFLEIVTKFVTRKQICQVLNHWDTWNCFLSFLLILFAYLQSFRKPMTVLILQNQSLNGAWILPGVYLLWHFSKWKSAPSFHQTEPFIHSFIHPSSQPYCVDLLTH